MLTLFIIGDIKIYGASSLLFFSVLECMKQTIKNDIPIYNVFDVLHLRINVIIQNTVITKPLPHPLKQCLM